jgi:hypothetical protein
MTVTMKTNEDHDMGSISGSAVAPAPVFSATVQIPGLIISGSPALAYRNGTLYLAYAKSAASDAGAQHAIWCAAFNGSEWSSNTDSGFETSSSPVLVAFKKKLYLLYQSTSNEIKYATSTDGISWSTESKVPAALVSGWPAAVTYQNTLYVVNQGASNDGTLWCTTTSDGTTWSSNVQISTDKISGSPALAVFKKHLYLVYRPNGTEQLKYMSYDGSAWSSANSVPCQLSESPALAVFNGTLYLVYQGAAATGTRGQLWYSAFDGNSWGPSTFVNNTVENASPALAVFPGIPDAQGTLVCAESRSDGSVYWQGLSDTNNVTGFVTKFDVGNLSDKNAITFEITDVFGFPRTGTMHFDATNQRSGSYAIIFSTAMANRYKVRALFSTSDSKYGGVALLAPV